MHAPVIHRIFSVITICSFYVLNTGFHPARIPATVISQDNSFENQILQYINEYRLSKNLPALQMNAVISSEAVKHSANMASGKTAFGHGGFDGRVSSLSKQLTNPRKFAENVAYGHLGAKEVVNVWLNSPGHRHNIEGPYSLTGIGTVKKDDGTIFFTQLFVAQ